MSLSMPVELGPVLQGLLFLFAAIGAVAAAIQIYQWLKRPSARLDATLSHADFVLPPPFYDLVSNIGNRQWWRDLISKSPGNEGDDDRAVANAVAIGTIDAINKALAVKGGHSWDSLCSYWRLSLHNIGSTKITGIKVFVPYSRILAISRPGEAKEVVVRSSDETREQFRIGDLSPNERATVECWQPMGGGFVMWKDHFAVTHDTGRVALRRVDFG